MVTDRIGEPYDIEPIDGHAFTEVGIGKKAFDEFCICLLGGIGLEGCDLFGARGQTDQIVVHTPNQCSRVSAFCAS